MVDRSEFTELASEKYGSKFNDLTEDAVDDLFSRFTDKLETFGDETLALTAAVGSYNFEENMDGDSQNTTIIAVGTNGPRPFGDTDALFCYGVVNPEDMKPGRIVVIVNEDDVKDSLLDIARMWETYEPVDARVNIRSSGSVSGPTEASGNYIGEIGVSDEPFEPGESDMSREKRIEFVKTHVPSADIATVSESFTQQDGQYAAAFGLDFKCVENAVVLDARVSSNGGRYVFQDDSFLDPEELSPDVRGDENEIGLMGWAEAHEAQFDQESMVDVFCTISPSNDSGQITSTIYGAAGAKGDESLVNSVDVDVSDSSDSTSQQSQSSESDSGTSGTGSSEPIEDRTI